MTGAWSQLAQDFETFDLQSKNRLLAEMGFQISIAARATYAPGTDDVDRPVQLRLLSELLHRIFEYQCNLHLPNLERKTAQAFLEQIRDGLVQAGVKDQDLLKQLWRFRQ